MSNSTATVQEQQPQQQSQQRQQRHKRPPRQNTRQPQAIGDSNSSSSRYQQLLQHQKAVAAAAAAAARVDTTTPGNKGDENDEVDEDDDDVCFICASPVEYYAIGPCNHSVCHMCSLRMRALYKQRECSMCKVLPRTEQQHVVFTTQADASFGSFDLAGMFRDDRLSIFFDSEQAFTQTMTLLRFNCPEPGCSEYLDGWLDLKKHVKAVHRQLLCELCVRHKKVFTHEHSLFTQDEPRDPAKRGTEDDHSIKLHLKQHPDCRFCHTHFYSIDELVGHCREKHEQCFLCLRRGGHNDYYQNYQSLEEHFNSQHFPCMHPSCLEKKFVVFESELDLRGHQLEAHADAKTRARGAPVALSFSYNSPSGSGQQESQRSGRGKKQQQGNNDDDRAGPSGRRNVPAGFGAQLTSAAPIPTAVDPLVDNYPPIGSTSTQQAAPIRRSPIPAALAPTPAEAIAILAATSAAEQPLRTQNQEQQVQRELEKIPALSGEPELVAALKRLFGASSGSVSEFKRLMYDFRQGNILATVFLDGFVRLSMANKIGKQIADARIDVGRVWNRLIETYPEEPSDHNEQAMHEAAKNKKKKKGMSLEEFEAFRRSIPKKEQMLRAWNDFRA
eukprot:jgi/Hompol1/3685/HPOL_001661-RA